MPTLELTEEQVVALVRQLPADRRRAALVALAEDANKGRDERMNHATQRFAVLAAKWKNETGCLSNISKKCTHPAYQQIIGMGESAILPILRDLKKTFADWYWALTAITGDNPISSEDAGDVQTMTEAWLQWGRLNGYDV